jgi:hypothetical protein
MIPIVGLILEIRRLFRPFDGTLCSDMSLLKAVVIDADFNHVECMSERRGALEWQWLCYDDPIRGARVQSIVGKP